MSGATDRPVSDLQEFSEPPAVTQEGVAGESPWRLAVRRMRKRRFALFMGAVFVLLVLTMAAAPLWAEHVAHTTPSANHLSDQIEVDGEKVNVVGLDGVPIGPTWQGQFFLGADTNGRDVAVRLLYGGRNSLIIGLGAALITLVLGLVTGLLAGYFRGWTDSILSRIMDVLWAFPVILLGIALGTSLALGGLKLGPVSVSGGSLAIPIFVIAIVYIPYLARPIRGEVLSLREKEFVEAARAQGMGSFRLITSEILPNVLSTGLVFFPLLVANAILLEAALSFLGAGVQPPEPSWGTMIDEGVARIVTAPALAIVPGMMIVLTVLSLNVFGEAIRDSLDPKAKVRIEH
ncbi:MAG TPA: ABC transporter permease [Solirubrobacterales bacterium]|nr:ABC transporter permease [Solirubrobacterales bacterium]HMY26226.1 ABC transporter permease [Solirubrobacterales bacterium]HNA23145.1 ABC transporter permease [Solirubrobacterales bacterium]HNA45013.1 ABC transporter permease [Solirubrobacterales bacterium]HNC93164.1 ABC transporter permease [Solirubrobacterales bacterium]